MAMVMLVLAAGACGNVEPVDGDAGLVDADAAVAWDAAAAWDFDAGRSCEPDTSTCADGTAIVCGAAGTVARVEECALGCDAAGTRCIQVVPSNDLGELLAMSIDAPVVALADGATIDTDAGEIRDGDGTVIVASGVDVAAPANGVGVRVFVSARWQSVTRSSPAAAPWRSCPTATRSSPGTSASRRDRSMRAPAWDASRRRARAWAQGV